MSPQMPSNAPLRFAILICAAAMLACCAARDALDKHAELEDPWVEDQPYPRLVDTEAPPPPGEFSAASPDPANGQAIIAELGPIAQENTIRGAALSGQSVLDPAFERQLQRQGTLPKPTAAE